MQLEELDPDLTELNQLIYATAYVVSVKTNNKENSSQTNVINQNGKERSKKRLNISEEKYPFWRSY